MPTDELDPDAVLQVRFRRSMRGYTRSEVDQLLEEVAQEFTRRCEGRDPVVTAWDVRHATFGPSAPGDDQEQVDEFLERLAVQLEEQED
jgi:DivIVA domain-containing protein